MPQLPGIYIPHAGVEDLENYKPHGYHPVHLNDELCNGRYTIIHKLGFGSYSTVWLAHDKSQNQYVALKIDVAHAAQSRDVNSAEFFLAGNRTTGDLGSRFVATILDEFFIDGPNGRHLVSVAEPAGCSVAISHAAGKVRRFPLTTARAITAQLILGVRYLHSMGIVHADLYPQNILFRSACSLDGLPVNAVAKRLGHPIKTPIATSSGAPLSPEVPQYSVQSAHLAIPCDKIQDPRILITDFGEAFSADTPPDTLNTPLFFQPPELLLSTRPPGPATDIWSLGCTIFNVFGSKSPFEVYLGDPDDVIAEIVSGIGPLPEEWWDVWSNSGEFFQYDGSWRRDMPRGRNPESFPLARRVEEIRGTGQVGGFAPGEEESLLRLLQRIFVYKPEERISAAEIAESDWMRDWGYPALREMGIIADSTR